MKSKYCFIRHQGNLKPDSFIYHVWVGSSLRESVKLALVEEYCKDVGDYFEKWSSEVDSQLDECRARFKVSGNPLASPFKSASVTISELYKLIIDDTFDMFEASMMMSATEKYKLFHHQSEYHRQANYFKVLQNASPSTRKYLSLAKRNVAIRAAICVALCCVLMALDAVVSCVMNW